MAKKFINSVILLLIAMTSFGQVKVVKKVALSEQIRETSGLVYYQNKYLITHNDGGNKNDIFILNLKGEIIKKIEVLNAKNKDWEDLTQDDEGRLYIGDFGNNLNKREKCQIYILPNGFVDKKKVKAEKITFWYEDQKDFPPKKKEMNYDCEAFFWKDNKLYLLTKCRTKPYTGISKIYVIPAVPGKHKAKYLGKIKLCGASWRFCSITSADYNLKTNTLAILTYSKLYIVENLGDTKFWNRKYKVFSLPALKQREAICFKNKNTLYMSDEKKKGLGGGNLYELKIKKRK